MPLPPHLHAPLLEIITRLISHSTNAQPKRVYSELFQDLPDKKLYADYYTLIEEPRSLNGVLASLNKGMYSSPHIVAYDLLLIWGNARKYNQEGSGVYADADKLETCMQDLWNGRSPPLPSWYSLPPAGSLAPGVTGEKSAKRTLKLTSTAGAGDAGGSTERKKEKDANRKSKKERRKDKDALESDVHPQASTSIAGGSFGFKLKIKPKLAPSSSSGTVAISPSTTLPVPLSVRTPLPASFAARTQIDSPIIKKSLPTPIAPALAPDSANTSVGKSPRPLSASSSTLQFTSLGSHRPSNVTQAESRKEKATSRDQMEDIKPSIDGMHTVLAHSSPTSTLELSNAQRPPISSALGKHSTDRSATKAREEIASSGDNGWMPDGSGDLKERMAWVATELRHYRDESGRLLSAPLYSLPDPVTRPDYYENVKDPIALDTIDQRIAASHYSSAEQFDRDLYRLFQIAKIFMGPESPGTLWPDLLLAQRRYHELTKPGASPVSLTAYTSGVTDPVFDKVFHDGVHFKGEYLKVGDWIHLNNPANPAKPIIGHIFRVFIKAGTVERHLTVCWYCRPEETVHPANRMFFENEVFKSGHIVDHPLEDVVERCFVMHLNRYVQGRPNQPHWNASMAIYVCESRYKYDSKTFKKIKAWETCLPELVKKLDYDWTPHVDGREVLKRVESPFAHGMDGTGGIVRPDSALALPPPISAASAHPSAQPRPIPFITSPIAPKRALSPSLDTSSPKSKIANGTSTPPANHSPRPFSAYPLSAYPPPDPALALHGVILSAMTPSQLAAVSQKFDRLPDSLQRKFQCDSVTGDLLWFSAPPLLHEAILSSNSRKKRKLNGRGGHTIEYLMWKAEQLSHQISRDEQDDAVME